jgi:hypothetical protein
LKFDHRGYGTNRWGWGWNFDIGSAGSHGPAVRFNSDGSVKKMTFHCIGKSSTEDINVYLKWYEEGNDLPQVVPGIGNILAPLRRRRRLAKAADRPLDPSGLPEIPRGLEKEKVHVLMMKLWSDSNSLRSKKDYAGCEKQALFSAQVALAYPSEGPRAARIGYQKASSCAEMQGAPGRVASYAVKIQELGG